MRNACNLFAMLFILAALCVFLVTGRNIGSGGGFAGPTLGTYDVYEHGWPLVFLTRTVSVVRYLVKNSEGQIVEEKTGEKSAFDRWLLWKGEVETWDARAALWDALIAGGIGAGLLLGMWAMLRVFRRRQPVTPSCVE